MRVIAGTARGVPLQAPRGRGTRPITDRVKETLFAIIGPEVIDAAVLDLYAGSGAIGIEALSRGARLATFVEHGREACAVIRRNLERTRLVDSGTVVGSTVERFLDLPPTEAYDIVVLDPPYDDPTTPALQRLQPHLARPATVVVKHFWRTEIAAPDWLTAVRSRRFGETALTFLVQTAAVVSDAMAEGAAVAHGASVEEQDA